MMLVDSCLTPWALTYGVPQGSVLSPMLFNIYMKQLGEIVQSFEIWYADDTQLYLSLPPKSEEAVSALNQFLVSLMD